MIVAKLVNIKKFELENERIYKLNKDQVLVKISSSAICGSDLHYFRHGGLGTQKPNFPISLGHETCGIIVDKNGSNFKILSGVIYSVSSNNLPLSATSLPSWYSLGTILFINCFTLLSISGASKNCGKNPFFVNVLKKKWIS